MRIAAIDDEQSALTVLRYELNQVMPEAELHTYTDPAVAVAELADWPCDVVFCDIAMPRMSGLEVAKKLKAINAGTNIIFVTAFMEYAYHAIQLRASGYLAKPITAEALREELDNLRYPCRQTAAGPEAVTFGQFEFFLNGEPLHFRRAKSKELLAYLIDCEGRSVNKKECMTALFEGREYDSNMRDYLGKIARDLEATLDGYGLQGLLRHSYNDYSVDTTRFRCDLYDYLKGDPQAINRFRGEYMVQYGWSEFSMEKFYH